MGKKKRLRTTGKSQLPAASAEALRKGRKALEAYEYDQARTHLEQALQASEGAVEPALALLELLVDALADDEAALALPLPSTTAGHGEVRTLLALAAARSGQQARAIEALAGTRGKRAQSALLLLARRALDESSLKEARAFLTQARAVGTPTTGLLRLEACFEVAAAELLAPREVRMSQLLTEGQLDAAEDDARSVLELWPGSEVARSTLKVVQERRQTQKAQQQLAAADAAFERGALQEAMAGFEAILAAGGASSAIHSRLQACRGAIQAEELRQRQQQAMVAWEDERYQDCLSAYGDLPPEHRHAVRAQLEWSALSDAEALAALTPGRSPQAEELEAALALWEVQQPPLRADPEAALAHLRPHNDLLQRFSPARDLLETRRRALGAFREARAIAALESLAQGLDEGDLEAARVAFQSLRPQELPEIERGRGADLSQRLEVADRRQALERAFEKAEAAGQLGEAMAILQQLHALLLEGDSEAWEVWNERRHHLSERIRAVWPIIVLNGQEATAFGLDDVLYRHPDGDLLVGPWDAHNTAVVVSATGRWLWVRLWFRQETAVQRVLGIATPHLWTGLQATLDRGRLRIVGAAGQRLEIGLDGEVYEHHAPERPVLRVGDRLRRDASKPSKPGEGLPIHTQLDIQAPGGHEERWRDTDFPPFEGPFACAPRAMPEGGRAQVLAEAFQATEESQRSQFLDQFQREAGSSGRLLDMVLALRHLDEFDSADKVLDWTRLVHDDAPDFRFEKILAAAASGAWEEVLRLARSFDPDGLRYYGSSHLYHLTGLAHFRKENYPTALEDWQLGAQRDGSCDCDGYVALLLPPTAENPAPWPSGSHRVDALRIALRTADRHLKQRDPEGAIRLLWHPAVWASQERQTLARLAEAFLFVKPEEPLAKLRKTLSLATYLECHQRHEDQPAFHVAELPFPKERWRSRRLADIARRAERWLASLGA